MCLVRSNYSVGRAEMGERKGHTPYLVTIQDTHCPVPSALELVSRQLLSSQLDAQSNSK